MALRVDIIQSEGQSLALMKHLISTSFSCIGYLRDLFEEKNFTDHFLCDLALKRLARGMSPEADTFLDWIELGIYDALDKKYLRTIYLGIFIDPDDPKNVLEWYTFKVAYAPFNSDHVGADISSLSIEQNDKEILHFSQKEIDFKRSAVQILRTMCILTQTLKSLPAIKYLTIRIYYYEDRTPSSYQPPLFLDCPDEIFVNSRGADSLRFDLGQAATPFHTYVLPMY
ncbi:hypothetical protein DI09_89p70 [Mitosporidium daphniae]|uniref:HORMA domain-containing protein n=1 Tax=Mitosporidium daphniae TaxID=1485682 RepID=A0A098VM14_9MICR|nr:uncharacterized protein DI09_89p70 [Mitosporidium daphniae]KGG50113.1 hypothetical protein DI09_89p70 [Mitosporidium daphniae]|eukprot:XP_013236549.1 uncharacterized protein DI09_89p70 [Mitosporidium daphniae]